jgi:hypothetical protein
MAGPRKIPHVPKLLVPAAVEFGGKTTPRRLPHLIPGPETSAFRALLALLDAKLIGWSLARRKTAIPWMQTFPTYNIQLDPVDGRTPGFTSSSAAKIRRMGSYNFHHPHHTKDLHYSRKEGPRTAKKS